MLAVVAHAEFISESLEMRNTHFLCIRKERPHSKCSLKAGHRSVCQAKDLLADREFKQRPLTKYIKLDYDA